MIDNATYEMAAIPEPNDPSVIRREPVMSKPKRKSKAFKRKGRP